ncbi:MAG: hypothetical protein RLZZ262_1111 [Bacteroidota bacterium]|jgi:hypothetical protein
MRVSIRHAETYSRGQLILRTLFGIFYIMIPHFLVMLFVIIGVLFVNFIAFWAILITGRYPEGLWKFMFGFFAWQVRLNARLNNLSDGYPAIGPNGSDTETKLEIEYQASYSRGLVLARLFFGLFYIMIPHGFCLFFLSLAAAFVKVFAFWIVLITAKYPKGLHDFMVGVIRWNTKVGAYYYNLTDTYPPFRLSEVEDSSTALDKNI